MTNIDNSTGIHEDNCSHKKSNTTGIEANINDYSKIIELDPKNISAYMNRAQLKESDGYLFGAIEDYTHILDIDPNNNEAYTNRNRVKETKNILDLIDEGFNRFYKREYQKAIDCFDKVIELNPNDAEVHNGKGCALYILGNKEEAIKCFDKAIELMPDLIVALENKEAALNNVKPVEPDYDDSDCDVSRKNSLHYFRTDNDPEPKYFFYCDCGFEKLEMNDINGAIQDYLKAVEIDSKYHLANSWLGKIFCDKKEYAEAAKYLHMVIENICDGIFELFRKDYSDEEWEELTKVFLNEKQTS